MGIELIRATKPAGCIDSSSQGYPIVGAPCFCNDQIVFRQDCEWSSGSQNCSNIKCDG